MALTQKKLKELINLADGMLEGVAKDKDIVIDKFNVAVNESTAINPTEDENLKELSEDYQGLLQTQNYYQGRKDLLNELLEEMKNKK